MWRVFLSLQHGYFNCTMLDEIKLNRKKGTYHALLDTFTMAVTCYSCGDCPYPLFVSAVSAFCSGSDCFVTLIAGVMVSVVDVLALLGLVFYIAQIRSPFQFLRHLLPFVSILPLGLEMYALLAHNSLWIAVSVASVVTIILVVIAWQCFRTIGHCLSIRSVPRVSTHSTIYSILSSLTRRCVQPAKPQPVRPGVGRD